MSNIGKVCVKCQIELRPKENGVGAVEMAGFGPSALYDADLWFCPGCGIEVLLGFGRSPIAEHFDGSRFAAAVALYPHTIQFWMNEKAKEGAA